MSSQTKSYYAKSCKDWRKWLKNNPQEKKVFLIKYKKHTGKPSLTNIEAMKEAICFGWIDTTVKRIDEQRYQQCFVKRNEKSRWSNNTLRYAQEMIKESKMTPAGLKRYQEGLKKPVLDRGLPKNPGLPDDLKKLLSENKKAQQFFEQLAASYRRNYIYWIEEAKRSETRTKRVNKVLELLLQGKKQGM